jgi:hypothetical protein
MRDIPIIFSASMVRALLREAREQGTGKSMTRRPAWPYVKRKLVNDLVAGNPCLIDPRGRTTAPSPWQRAKPGDWLWVRETIKGKPDDAGFDGIEYAADNFHTRIPCANDNESQERFMEIFYYRRGRGLPVPSIHMPRWASRLTLVVTKTKIERLQEIDEQDIEREGIYWKNGLWRCPAPAGGDWHATEKAIDCWRWLWTKINGAESWEQNPEVVAITFCVHKTNIDSMKEAA